MSDRASRTLALALFLLVVVRPPVASGQGKPADPPRKVLVELYSSQGCDSCPAASDLVGRLKALGYGPDRIVPINFHVDYFNKPWVDPFSDAAYSRRQWSYNEVLDRKDLYFTPLMMVDGQTPLLGSDRAKAVAAIEKSLKAAAGVNLDLTLEGTGEKKTLSVKLSARNAKVAGRDLLIGVALTEDPVSTKVPRGENAGKTLVEHHVVRRFDHKFVKLERKGTRTLAFPVELPPDADPARFRVTVFAQDRADGDVHQADSIPWVQSHDHTSGMSDGRARDLKQAAAWRKARRGIKASWLDTLAGLGSGVTMPNSPADDPPSVCPACGNLFTPPPPHAIFTRPGQSVTLPPIETC